VAAECHAPSKNISISCHYNDNIVGDGLRLLFSFADLLLRPLQPGESAELGSYSLSHTI